MRRRAPLPARVVWVALLATPAVAQPSLETPVPLPSSPGVFAGALGGLGNPAAWATAGGELAFAWDDRSHLDRWTLALGAPFGIAVERAPSVWRYQTGLAHGDGRWLGGFAWKWSAGDDGTTASESGLVSGLLYRPNRYLSFGQSGFLSAETSCRSGLLELGIRPFGSSFVTLFGDYAREWEGAPDDGRWSAGAEWRPFRGVHLGARAREARDGGDPEIMASVGLTIDGLGYHEVPHFDSDGHHGATQRIVRVNPPHRDVPLERWRESRRPRRLVVIDLEGKTVGYRKDLWFDDDRVAWLDLVRALRAVRDDPGAAGVALNLSAARIRPAILWEMRRELQAIRDAGKRVVVQVESPRMSHLYLASVADYVQADPFGWVDLTGIAARRTYWKGLLDKLGIGFEELRFFTYKSAEERYSRSDMSEVDREQIGRMVDVIYEEFVDGIAEGRHLPAEEIVRLGEEEAVLRAAGARDAGLVDALGRWEDLVTWAEGQGFTLGSVRRRRPAGEERWGRPPVLALVYADGASEMDEGFRGRATGDHLRKLAKRGDVAAVVLRADSPGGDPMAADRIAKGMAALRRSGKPVLASQGDVAASAGYSICLESDRIYTTPLTITGSIGVISGWAWDEGLGEKTGFSADGVQRGSHADLWTGIRFPFIPVPLPQRNLTDKERELMKARILSAYDDFVREVATARDLPEARVRQVAEGRVWMGGDAMERDLVDAAGTLGDVLEDARVRAGLDVDDELVIEEFPGRRLFHLPQLLPGLPGLSLGAGTPDVVEAGRDDGFLPLRILLERPGEPCRLLPLGQVPFDWLGAR